MYRIEYLPVALRDLVDIAAYIGVGLDNPNAADRLAANIAEKVSAAAGQPYMYPLYIPIKPIKHEYRKSVAGNCDVFYWIDELLKTVTVARVIYAGRDIKKFLK